MNFIDPQIEDYALRHTSEESEVLKQLNRETHLKVLRPRMLSGHLQGRLLSMFSKMLNPERILEIGTYTGYATICLAEGLLANGIIHTIENNAELKQFANKYFIKAGIQDKVKFHIGNALDIIPELDETFDLVFIDADKENYTNYFELIIDKVRPGGIIIADNVLWSGKVLESFPDKDTETLGIVNLNELVKNDNRIENMILPLRDGLMLMRKK
ncbi:O-methyltransferase [Bacteroidota bacterium]